MCEGTWKAFGKVSGRVVEGENISNTNSMLIRNIIVKHTNHKLFNGNS